MKYNKFRLLSNVGNQRGDSIIILPIIIFFIVVFLWIGVDILGIYSTYSKLKLASSETLNYMKMYNGWNQDSQIIFDNLIKTNKLDPSKVVVNGTVGKVQRGDVITITAYTTYETRALKPFDKTFIVPIQIQLSGIAQEFIR